MRQVLDHLLDGTCKTSEKDECHAYLNHLRLALLAHNRAEEFVFYEILREASVDEETAQEKTDEHRSAEFLVDALEALAPEDRAWGENLRQLKKILESHFANEETGFFSLVQKLISPSKAEQVGGDFEYLRKEALRGGGADGSFEQMIARTGPSLMS